MTKYTSQPHVHTDSPGAGAVSSPPRPLKPTTPPSFGGRQRPQETVREIFRNLDKTSLVVACLSNRTYGSIAQAVLFEVVSIAVVEHRERSTGRQRVIASSSRACYRALTRRRTHLAMHVRSLTLALAPAEFEDEAASAGNNIPALEAFGKLARKCTGLRILNLLDGHRPVLFKSLPILPVELVNLRALTISAASLRNEVLRKIAANVASHLTHLTVVSSYEDFCTFDLRPFSSLTDLELRVEGVRWGRTKAGKYLKALKIEERCPWLEDLRLALPDSNWYRTDLLEESPAAVFIEPLRRANMDISIEVHTKGWTLVVKPGAKVEVSVSRP